ncbi:hypothetical protein UA74_27665 [Actinoalloteichus fjordicus]|uniref:Uncharacterized protein n=1 Tax=Actinoalloteichus fjordicus TaxID=1612552 RepID=A0AAC9LH11_9PSEU|nr:hypothetical protein UA74_27665 [Actinoalloteichus fjordicus]
MLRFCPGALAGAERTCLALTCSAPLSRGCLAARCAAVLCAAVTCVVADATDIGPSRPSDVDRQDDSAAGCAGDGRRFEPRPSPVALTRSGTARQAGTAWWRCDPARVITLRAAVDEGADRAAIPEAGQLERARVLVSSVLGSLFLGCLTVIALTVLTLATAGDDAFSLGAVLSVSVPAWLAAHQVPLMILGQPVGVLPLLPTLILLSLIATSVASTLRRLAATLWTSLLLVALTAAGHGVLAVAFAEVATGGSAGLVIVSPSSAGLTSALLAAAAAAVGVLRCGVLAAWFDGRPRAVQDGVRAGLLGAACLLATGASVTLFGLFASGPEVVELFNQDRLSDALGLLLCSLAYLPNAVTAGVAFAAGPGFSLGQAVVTPFAARTGPELELPLLAALPDTAARPWWALVLLLPIAVGVLLGWFGGGGGTPRRDRLRTAVVGVVIAASIASAAAVVAGGRLGSGAFDPVQVPAASLALAVLVWTGLPAVLVAWLGRPQRAADETAAATVEAAHDVDESAGDAASGDAAAGDAETDDEAADDAEPDDPEESEPADERLPAAETADDAAARDDAEPDVGSDDVAGNPSAAESAVVGKVAGAKTGTATDDVERVGAVAEDADARRTPRAARPGTADGPDAVVLVPSPREDPAVDAASGPAGRGAQAERREHSVARSAEVSGVVLPSPGVEAAAVSRRRGSVEESAEVWPQDDPDAPGA